MVLVWALPKDLAFRSFIATRNQFSANIVEGWSVENVNRWLELFNLPPSNLTGSALLHNSVFEIIDQLNIEDDTFKEEIARRVEELRKEPDGVEPPHEFLCPITHQLMRDPVIAAVCLKFRLAQILCATGSWPYVPLLEFRLPQAYEVVMTKFQDLTTKAVLRYDMRILTTQHLQFLNGLYRTNPAYGGSYERSAIESWFATGRITSPMTNEILDSTKLEPNTSLRQSIANYLDI